MTKLLQVTLLAGILFCCGITGAIVVTGGAGLASGSIVMWDGTSCPSGFDEVTALRGRYPVGTPASGTFGAQIGTALTDTENRPTGQHNHTVPMKESGGGAELNADQGNGVIVGSATTADGFVAGTNGPYRQILFCKKP